MNQPRTPEYMQKWIQHVQLKKIKQAETYVLVYTLNLKIVNNNFLKEFVLPVKM